MPGLGQYLPGGQSLHVALPLVLYVPLAHNLGGAAFIVESVLLFSPQNEPAGHVIHVCAPISLYVPGVQGTQAPPAVGLYVRAGQ